MSLEKRTIMKPKFELMAPQWIAFPALTEFTIGWRMGAGEDYKWKFWDWYETLTPAQQKEYQALFPYPCFRQGTNSAIRYTRGNQTRAS